MKTIGFLGLFLTLVGVDAAGQTPTQPSQPAQVLMPPGMSHDTTVAVAVYGRGKDSCGSWLEGQRVLESHLSPGAQLSLPSDPGEISLMLRAISHGAFVQGYVTAASDPVTVLTVLGRVVDEYGKSVTFPSTSLLRQTDEAGIRAAITKFCTDNPTQTILRAAEALVVTLKR